MSEQNQQYQRHEITKQPAFAPGMRINKLTVIGPAYENRYGQKIYSLIECQCDCGTKFIVSYQQLYQNGGKYSCGCVRRMSGLRDLSGQTFGRLTVLDYWTKKGWKCICSECGQDEFYTADAIEDAGVSACIRSITEKLGEHMVEIIIKNFERLTIVQDAASKEEAVEKVKARIHIQALW